MTITTTRTKPEAISSRLPDIGVFVECLATRNSLDMHGFWVDLEQIAEVSDWQACIDYILATSPQPNAEEYEETDNTCPSFLLPLDAAQRIEWVENRAKLAYDERMQEAYETYCSDRCSVIDLDTFHSAFLGFFKDEEDYVIGHYEDRGENFSELLSYIDWERVWDGEFSCNGYTSCDVYGSHRNGREVAIFRPV